MKAPETTRVAVLLFSDLVGSVSLQARIGTEAYSQLLGRHDEIFQAAIEAEGGGRVLNDTGDGFLAEFPSPTGAVRAALRFQYALNGERWGRERLEARTAVHLGEIKELARPVSGRPRLLGMAINYVAR